MSSSIPDSSDSFSWDFDYEDYEEYFHGYHSLMRNKIQNILLVSSPYDAFTLEEDSRLSEQIFGEYKALELSSPPRIYSVSSGEKALKELKGTKYDLIITMSQLFDFDPIEFGMKAKKVRPNIPIVLLATDNTTLAKYHEPGEYRCFDKIFLWLGDSAIFLAIIKYFEDRSNVDDDTRKANARVILVIEDSARYYSSFLPIIYKEVMRQTQALVEEGLNEHEKQLRRRERPKILFAETFEEGEHLYKKYREYILGIVTDISFPRHGTRNVNAGFQFVEMLDKYIPVLFQSSNDMHAARANRMDHPFLNKNSETMLRDLSEFIKKQLGFGDFVFRMPDGTEIDRATGVKEFVEMIKRVSPESLKFHGKAFQFSGWFFARGEFDLATKIRKKKFSEFKTVDEIRDYLVNIIIKKRKKRQMGFITDFSRQRFEFSETFTRYGKGSLGGKGRGIAFLSAMLRMTRLNKIFPDFNVCIPETLVITTDEFDSFIHNNGLHEMLDDEIGDEEVASKFVSCPLSDELQEALKRYLGHVNVPIAVRSSSLLEDSLHQPFAGIYSTYILPNNKSLNERLEQLQDAIKLVYASAFFNLAKTYIRSTSQKVEEEKMAVVIQKLVGNAYNGRFYPLFSGVAMSRNYYPLPPLDRESGMASVAVGLGKIVMDGGKVLSFSPGNPRHIPGFSTPREILQNSQQHIYCLDLDKEDIDLRESEEITLEKIGITEAEKDGILDLFAGVYDANDDIIRDGAYHDGYKVITFANILKYEHYPLVGILKNILDIGTKGLGGPVEIEFAVSKGDEGILKFHLLQIRPIISTRERNQVEIEEEPEPGKTLVYSTRAFGNGLIEDIRDAVLVLPSDFERGNTPDIACEIEVINSKIKERPYVLIGPGRWGSFDRWLGIPVKWSQISRVGVMVETSMPERAVIPSQGSHFFHNITAQGILYLTVADDNEQDLIDWDWLREQECKWKGKYTRHIHFSRSLTIKVDGKEGRGIIFKP